MPASKSKKAKTDATPENLTLLGGSPTMSIPRTPNAATIETFHNRFPHRDYEIRFDCEDFTSLCPVTGQPDFAKIRVEYIADERCIETKSLKFYLSSYRNTRSFNEEVVNQILEHLVEACAPRWMLVQGEFAQRGGIRVTVEAEHDGHGWESSEDDDVPF